MDPIEITITKADIVLPINHHTDLIALYLDRKMCPLATVIKRMGICADPVVSPDDVQNKDMTLVLGTIAPQFGMDDVKNVFEGKEFKTMYYPYEEPKKVQNRYFNPNHG